ncbi:MAG: hypothetical protein Q4P20_11425 [Eubacteriales bacterium]|nr:hypothetical protein [Eubacteriales bacterium]
MTEVRSIGYSVKFQTETKYKSIKYGQGTIYSSACGPASLCNALMALGIADISIPTMCELAVACGARVSGGTVMTTLLQAAAPKYNFKYSTTSKNATLLAHLQAGGAAILHAGTAYQLFSTGGHFVTAAAAEGQTITVLDSYWYSGKYAASAIRRNYVNVVQNGVIKTSLTQCGKATIDRSPSYYLISRAVVTDKTSAQAVKQPKKEEDMMKYYKELKDIPEYYREAVKKLIDQGAITGTGNELNLSEDLCRAFTILDRAGAIPHQ